MYTHWCLYIPQIEFLGFMYIRHKFNQTINLGKIVVRLDKGTFLKKKQEWIPQHSNSFLSESKSTYLQQKELSLVHYHVWTLDDSRAAFSSRVLLDDPNNFLLSYPTEMDRTTKVHSTQTKIQINLQKTFSTSYLPLF